MNGPTKLGAFAAAAVLAMGGAAAVGAAVGPIDEPTTDHPAHQEATMSPTTIAPSHGGHTGAVPDPQAYLLEADTTVLTAGRPTTLTFRVVQPDGSVATSFEERHERPMHLILVSADLVTYAHLHPSLAGDGTWTTALPALAPGGYRLVADTVPAGAEDQLLTADLLVPGSGDPVALPEPATTAVVDDLEVQLALAPEGQGAVAALTVTRNGAPVRLDPYLGARGHLVAIDARDLGYLHVHPEDGVDPAAVSFAIAGTEPGRHRLFFDFSVEGQVRTAAFTVDLAGAPSEPTSAAHSHEGQDHR